MSTSSHEKIGLGTAVVIGMNAMIGAGIFSVTTLLGSKIGPAGIITYLIALLSVWFIAQAFARVAFLFPTEGSFYTYAYQWGGHTAGLLSAGAYLLGLLIAMGLLCNIGGQFLHATFPVLSATNWGFSMLITLVLLNMLGMVLSKVGQYILIAATLYPLIITTLLCLCHASWANLTPFMPHGALNVLLGTKIAIFGLFGFESVASLFNHMHQPEKTVPKALKLTIIIVGTIYFAFIGSILIGIPQSIFVNNPNITISQALLEAFPAYPLLTGSIGLSIISAIAGTIHAMIWSSSALMLSFFKMLRLPWLTKGIHNNTITHRTTVLIAGIIIGLSFFTIHNLSVFFSLADAFLMIAFITAIITLLCIKSEWKSGQNYMTIIGVFSAFMIFGIAAQTLIQNLIA